MPRRFINLNHSIHSHSSAIIRRLLTNAEKTRNRFFGVTGLFLAISRDRSNRLKHPIKKSQPAQLFEGKGKLQQKEPGNENRRHFRHRGLQKKTRFKNKKCKIVCALNIVELGSWLGNGLGARASCSRSLGLIDPVVGQNTFGHSIQI